jgi:hypothetical protein
VGDATLEIWGCTKELVGNALKSKPKEQVEGAGQHCKVILCLEQWYVDFQVIKLEYSLESSTWLGSSVALDVHAAAKNART